MTQGRSQQGDEGFRSKEREPETVARTCIEFSHGLVLHGGNSDSWCRLLLQQLTDVFPPSDLFQRRHTWMEEWLPSSCKQAFEPGPLVTVLWDPELDILRVLLLQVLGHSVYSGPKFRRSKVLGTHRSVLSFIILQRVGVLPGAKSESWANSPFSRYGWGGSTGAENAKVKVKTEPSREQGQGAPTKRRLSGGPQMYKASSELKGVAKGINKSENRFYLLLALWESCLKWPEMSSGKCLIELWSSYSNDFLKYISESHFL